MNFIRTTRATFVKSYLIDRYTYLSEENLELLEKTLDNSFNVGVQKAYKSLEKRILDSELFVLDKSFYDEGMMSLVHKARDWESNDPDEIAKRLGIDEDDGKAMLDLPLLVLYREGVTSVDTYFISCLNSGVVTLKNQILSDTLKEAVS